MMGLRYGFQIGQLHFIYNAQLAAELVKSSMIYPIPNTPEWMLGLINLRGSLVPVFELNCYFNLPTDHRSQSLILVLGKGEKVVGISLTDYPQLLSELTILETLPALDAKIHPYITAVYQSPDRTLWLELDKEKFFTDLGIAVCK